MASMETSCELTRSPALFPAVLTTSYREDEGEAEKFTPLLFYVSQRECRVLGTREKGRSISGHVEMVSAGNRGIVLASKISKEVNHLLPFLSEHEKSIIPISQLDTRRRVMGRSSFNTGQSQQVLIDLPKA